MWRFDESPFFYSVQEGPIEEKIVKTVRKEVGGRPLIIETGKMARQADGAVTVRYGETVVLVAAVKKPLEEIGSFLPLMVEYREKTFAVGKIPGGFFKREGRPTTKEILSMRLIDRTIRPLIPAWFQHEIQVIAMVLSADQENDPDVVAITGASAALMLGGIAMQAPVAAVRVGRIDGEFIVNPTHSELKNSEMNLVVAGTSEAIVMVEGEAKEVSENVAADAIVWAHQYIKGIIPMQLELSKDVICPVTAPVENKKMADMLDGVREKFYTEIEEGLKLEGKKKQKVYFDNLYTKVKEEILKETEADEEKLLNEVFEKIRKEVVRKAVCSGTRCDGRDTKQIRTIHSETGLLPRAHGSALFTRGETQALVVATLGNPTDEQVVEGLMPETSKKFMLHYNFPPFSVGDIRFLRGPSRREIGHGNLAERAINNILPEESRFPYTIRIVSEVLESNGSSSMATVCGSTLSLMDAGVPIKRPVAGIAMGLVKEGDQVSVLSDISELEDHYGDMDFKVAGTQRGITALQMDIKISGISREILVQALEQSQEGRIYILREMMKVLSRPRREISDYAPQIIQMKIDSSKIATVIGPGGKTIRNIQEITNSNIDIKDDGTITIYCKDKEGMVTAKRMVAQLTDEVKVGKIYKGKVISVKDFGAFVEIAPGMEGLVHVSELEKNYVQNVGDVVKVGDEISVKVLAVDDQNRIKLSKRAADREGSKYKPKRS